ncbi:bifunctional riboflavin kinase/FAD synthetase [bacterium]|nr:bifunctional riboflavin kinase/FAD synthetase [bacterium]
MPNVLVLSAPLPAANGAVVTIGNFDGVHLGHRQILARVRETARAAGAVAVALTFDPHPIKLLDAEKAPPLLYPHDEKVRLLEEAGADLVAVQPFTREVADMPARVWAASALADQLRARHVVVGYDFRFGQDASGDAAMLAGIGAARGFDVERVGPVIEGDAPVSSTRIRDLVAAGQMEEAARLLTRPFFVRGTVSRGHGRGRGLGVPTANIRTPWETIPRGGVYAAIAERGAHRYAAAVNIGTNPTFGDGRLSIEAHMLEHPDIDLYGETIAIHFLSRLRDETKYESTEELVEQMSRDIEMARDVAGKRIED